MLLAHLDKLCKATVVGVISEVWHAEPWGCRRAAAAAAAAAAAQG
jgi:hypothetical protein